MTTPIDRESVERLVEWAHLCSGSCAKETAETLRALRDALDKYETELTKVMAADFKCWHDNSKEEWPIVAAMVIADLRKRLSLTLDLLEVEKKRLDDAEATIAFQRATIEAYEDMAPPMKPNLLRERLKLVREQRETDNG